MTMQSLGQAVMQRPQALQNSGKRKGLGLVFVFALVMKLDVGIALNDEYRISNVE
jgi:hypothetical protein